MKTQFEKLAEQCLEGVTRVEENYLHLANAFRVLVTRLVDAGVIDLDTPDPAPIEVDEAVLDEGE